MSRILLSLLCGLALTGGVFAQTETHPNESSQLTRDSSGDYIFSFWDTPERYYFLQCSEDMLTWSYFPQPIDYGFDQSASADNPYSFSVSGPDRFFVRLKYLESFTGDPLATDFDGDKVVTLDELESGTDPFDAAVADADLDGMADDWEILYGLDPEDAGDATDDFDEDGITNLAEYQNGPLGSDPTDPYNGANYPTLTVLDWPAPPGPTDEPSTLVPTPIVVEVRDGATPVNNARITLFTDDADPAHFDDDASLGQISQTNDGSGLATRLHLHTGADGRVQVYFKHPPANPPVPTWRYIRARVGSAILTKNGRVVSATAITQHEYTYPANTVGLNATLAIDSRIDPIATNAVANAKLIYSAQNHGAATYTRNTASWCYDLRQQMTCISPWNGYSQNLGAGTAITAQHIVGAVHNQMYPPFVIRFITASNQVIVRNVRGKVLHPNYATNGYYDIAVYTLDSPLPASITPCKLLPANYADYLSYLENGRPPVLSLDQEEKALVTELRLLDFFAVPVSPGLHRKRLDFFEGLVGGDSGNPAFLIINNDPATNHPANDSLVLLWTHTSVASIFLTPEIAALNAMIAAADADAVNTSPFTPINTGLQVQTADLSGFNTYTPPTPP